MRAQCLSNLRQIGIAVHSYHDTHECFPQGTVPNKELAAEKRLSWLVSLVPHVSEDSTLPKPSLEKGWDTPENEKLGHYWVGIYLCPADPARPSATHRWGNSGQPAPATCLGIAGVGADAAELPLKDSRAGCFGHDRKISLADIKDGTSDTLIILEASVAFAPWVAGGSTTVRGLDPSDQPYIRENGPFGRVHRDKDSWRFATLPHNTYTVLADGSARVLYPPISSKTLEALATIAGGDQPDSDW